MTAIKTIVINQVSKKFCRDPKKIIHYSLSDISKSILGFNENSAILRPGEFWALKNISFEINKGEVWGIIGSNGSGKSTLLKLINGIFMPDKGEISLRGKVGALIAAGAGFHPMLTGRENIYINGVILGMTKKEIDRKFKTIVEFSQIGRFLDTPVRHYSTGMYVRLGFSIAIHSLPEIMLIDEILSVGDVGFQKRALKKMTELVKIGKTVIFVSHNLGLVSSFTQKALYLKAGQIKSVGKSKKVINDYLIDEKI